MKGTLFLIPTIISDAPYQDVLPQDILTTTNRVDEFIVENIKTTRRYLRKIGFKKDFDQIPYHSLNKHTKPEEIPSFLKALNEGKNIGLFSEAGIPCIADPGAIVVKIAQQNNHHIKPLVGPSSILLSLMASGFNGQNFAFNGYLPIESKERNQKIKALETRVYHEDQTQIFIETPYRNDKLLKAFLDNCRNETLICVATEITSENEKIITRSVKQWKKNLPALHKQNTVFLMYKG
ncbi:MAG: SAM-dependent methyltransferase [Bacteroidota bacterium]|nr:SAM-dependent methyltransferase [Bacteroidota bacterium]